jgi:flagellum-specific ATP synthase
VTRQSLLERLQHYGTDQIYSLTPVAEGKLIRSVGMTLEAVGVKTSLGEQCQIVDDSEPGKPKLAEAEVVGFADDKIYLMPVEKLHNVQPGARVLPMGSRTGICIGEPVLGRVINGLGKVLDGMSPKIGNDLLPLAPESINPLRRHPIDKPLDVGVRAINALLTVGRGQRLGLFAGSGVGKSVLLGMMTKFTTADVVVVALIGERGREVKEFVDHVLGEEGMRRAVVVASPADEAPLMRFRAAHLATRVAEYFRDKGKNVLLLMDSLTRYAQAQREIALAVGEPPATRGYPPSVFAKIPQLVERAGNAAKGEGSITAFYTVLTEGDDLQDPIADSARAILDGHIVLSRQLADEGLFPAIDVEKSISRVMPNIVSKTQLADMQRFKQLLSIFQQNKDLISVGAYKKGADTEVDRALERMPLMKSFIRQDMDQRMGLATSIEELKNLIAPSRQSQEIAPASKPVAQSGLR